MRRDPCGVQCIGRPGPGSGWRMVLAERLLLNGCLAERVTVGLLQIELLSMLRLPRLLLLELLLLDLLLALFACLLLLKVIS